MIPAGYSFLSGSVVVSASPSSATVAIGTAASSGKYKAARLAAMYTMGASEFHLNVARASYGEQMTLGYNYNLSKRTKVYAFYTAVDATTANKADDFNSFAVGVRHNF